MAHVLVDQGDDDEEDKRVCHACIGEARLKAEIRRYGVVGTCGYCGQDRRRCVALSRLAERIDPVFRTHIGLADEEPWFPDDSDRVQWRREGEYPDILLADLIESAQYDIATDLIELMAQGQEPGAGDEGIFDTASDIFVRCTPPVDPRYRHAWAKFCEALKHKRRFFSREAKVLLDEIIGPILTGDDRRYSDAIRVIGPDNELRFLFRARLANDQASKKAIYSRPINALGAPPPKLASAGRMNPTGISVFYGSGDAETCVAELRVPVGGSAVVGKFEIIRPLRILDLRGLERARRKMSPFHPDFDKRNSYGAFIRGFHEEIRKPVIPGREGLDYLPSQVVAEYLWARAKKGSVDGVIFGSSQVSGDHYNIVLFPHACIVEGAEAEPARRVHRIYQHNPLPEEDDDDDEAPSEVVMLLNEEPPKPEIYRVPEAPWIEPPWDEEVAPQPPLASLRFVSGALRCLTVQAIQYATTEREVRMQDWQDSEF